MEQPKQLDHYEVLGIARDASHIDIKMAYRKKLLTTHPDKTHDTTNSGEKMDAITTAHTTLADPQKRENYDLSQGYKSNAQGKHNFPTTYQSNTLGGREHERDCQSLQVQEIPYDGFSAYKRSEEFQYLISTIPKSDEQDECDAHKRICEMLPKYLMNYPTFLKDAVIALAQNLPKNGAPEAHQTLRDTASQLGENIANTDGDRTPLKEIITTLTNTIPDSNKSRALEQLQEIESTCISQHHEANTPEGKKHKDACRALQSFPPPMDRISAGKRSEDFKLLIHAIPKNDERDESDAHKRICEMLPTYLIDYPIYLTNAVITLADNLPQNGKAEAHKTLCNIASQFGENIAKFDADRTPLANIITKLANTIPDSDRSAAQDHLQEITSTYLSHYPHLVVEPLAALHKVLPDNLGDRAKAIFGLLNIVQASRDVLDARKEKSNNFDEIEQDIHETRADFLVEHGSSPSPAPSISEPSKEATPETEPQMAKRNKWRGSTDYRALSTLTLPTRNHSRDSSIGSSSGSPDPREKQSRASEAPEDAEADKENASREATEQRDSRTSSRAVSPSPLRQFFVNTEAIHQEGISSPPSSSGNRLNVPNTAKRPRSNITR